MNKLYVIGLGPGGAYGMTAAARAALEEAEVICGYTVYLDLIAPLTPGKELRSTPMTRELDRCAMALELAGEALAPGLQGHPEVPADDLVVYIVLGVLHKFPGGDILQRERRRLC